MCIYVPTVPCRFLLLQTQHQNGFSLFLNVSKKKGHGKLHHTFSTQNSYLYGLQQLSRPVHPLQVERIAVARGAEIARDRGPKPGRGNVEERRLERCTGHVCIGAIIVRVSLFDVSPFPRARNSPNIAAPERKSGNSLMLLYSYTDLKLLLLSLATTLRVYFALLALHRVNVGSGCC